MKTNVLKPMRQKLQQMELPNQTKRYYARQWVRSVRYLGDKWILAKSHQRLL